MLDPPSQCPPYTNTRGGFNQWLGHFFAIFLEAAEAPESRTGGADRELPSLLGLSIQAGGSGGAIQPITGLVVGPTGNREARRRGSSFAGTDGNALMRAHVDARRSGAMHRRGVAEAPNVISRPTAKTDRIASAPVGIAQIIVSADDVGTGGHGPKLPRLHDRSNRRDRALPVRNLIGGGGRRTYISFMRIDDQASR
jgi:hypothetical protein